MDALHPHQSVDGRDDDDAAAPVRFHVRDSVAAAKVSALHIHPQIGVQVVGEDVGSGANGVADEDVQFAESRHRRLHHPLHLPFVGDIGVAINRRPTRLPNFADRLLPTRVVDVVDDNLRPFLSEAFGDAFADTPCGAGDDGDFALQPHRLSAPFTCP